MQNENKYSFLNENAGFFIIYTILYVLSFFPMVFITETFWDSWLFMPGVPDTYERLIQHGRTYMGPIIDFIAILDKPLCGILSANRILVFAIYYLSGLMLFYILSNTGLFQRQDSFWIALLSFVSPMNNARIIKFTFQFNLSVFTFCCGLFFLVKYFQNKKILSRFLSLLFFSISFFTEPFIAMYVLVGLLIFYHYKQLLFCNNELLRVSRNFIYIFKKYLDFFLLPIIYIVIRHIWLPTSGLYEGYYHRINSKLMINAFRLLPEMVSTGVFSLYSTTKTCIYMHPNQIIFISSICIILLISYFSGIHRLFLFSEEKMRFSFINSLLKVVGVFMLLLLALYTYGVSQNPVNYYPWASRCQVTLIPVIGMFIVVILRIIFRNKISYIFMTIIAAWFVSINTTAYISLLNFSHSQSAIIARMSETPELKRYNNYIAAFDLSGRPGPQLAYNIWYELTHWMCEAFGTDSRLGIHAGGAMPLPEWKHNVQYTIDTYNRWPGYGFSSYKQDKRILLIRVDPGKEKLTGKKAIFLSLKRLIDKNAYREDIQNLVRLSIFEIDWDTWDGSNLRISSGTVH